MLTGRINFLFSCWQNTDQINSEEGNHYTYAAFTGFLLLSSEHKSFLWPIWYKVTNGRHEENFHMKQKLTQHEPCLWRQHGVCGKRAETRARRPGGGGGLLMAATWTRGHQQSLPPRVSTKTELPQGLPYGSKIQFHTCR